MFGRMAASHEELSKRLDELEQRYDTRFKAVFDAIRALMEPPGTPERKIGFRGQRRQDRGD